MPSKYENNLSKITKILVAEEQKKIDLQNWGFFKWNGMSYRSV